MSDKTTQEELIDLLAGKLDCTKTHAANLLEAFQEAIELGIVTDGEARMDGLGTFKLKWNEARQGFNPATGENIEIEAQNRLIFSPQKQLAEAVNHAFEGLSAKPIASKAKKTKKTTPMAPPIPEKQEEAPRPVTEEVIQEKEAYQQQEKNEVLSNYFTEEEDKYRAVPEEEKPKRKWWLFLLLLLLLLILGYFGYQYIQKKKSDTPESEPIEEPIVKETPEYQDAVQEESATETEKQVVEKSASTQYEVRRGDTLWDIAVRNYGKGYLWVFLLESNSEVIKNPDFIKPGTQISIPNIDQASLDGQITPPLIDAYRNAGDSYKQAGLDKGDDFLRKVDLWKLRTK